MKKPASEMAYQLVRERIISGEWPQGTKLPAEVEIGRLAGVSRSSVREAIERLAEMGVLVRRQREGTYVKNASAKTLLGEEAQGGGYDVLQVLDFREMVEPEAVRRLIRTGDEKKLHIMLQTLDEMNRYADLRLSDEFAQADMRFHMAILRGAHNEVLDSVLAATRDPLIYYQFNANRDIGPRTGVQEHAAIIDAIFQKDEALAALLVKRHVQRSKRDLVAFREQQTGKGNHHE